MPVMQLLKYRCFIIMDSGLQCFFPCIMPEEVPLPHSILACFLDEVISSVIGRVVTSDPCVLPSWPFLLEQAL